MPKHPESPTDPKLAEKTEPQGMAVIMKADILVRLKDEYSPQSELAGQLQELASNYQDQTKFAQEFAFVMTELITCRRDITPDLLIDYKYSLAEQENDRLEIDKAVQYLFAPFGELSEQEKTGAQLLSKLMNDYWQAYQQNIKDKYLGN